MTLWLQRTGIWDFGLAILHVVCSPFVGLTEPR